MDFLLNAQNLSMSKGELDLTACACTPTHLTGILAPQLGEVSEMKLLCKLERTTCKGGSREIQLQEWSRFAWVPIILAV